MPEKASTVAKQKEWQEKKDREQQRGNRGEDKEPTTSKCKSTQRQAKGKSNQQGSNNRNKKTERRRERASKHEKEQG